MVDGESDGKKEYEGVIDEVEEGNDWLGINEGLEKGIMVGIDEGNFVEVVVGVIERMIVGVFEGDIVGELVGKDEGRIERGLVGIKVGIVVGDNKEDDWIITFLIIQFDVSAIRE